MCSRCISGETDEPAKTIRASYFIPANRLPCLQFPCRVG